MPLQDNIRLIRESDLDHVIEIERSCFDDPWPLRWFQRALISRDRFIGLFDDLGNLMGYALTAFEEDQLHIANLAIAPHYRRKGAGRTLVNDILQHCISKNAATVILEVRPSNEPAIKLYKSIGFVDFRVEESYYWDGEDALVLVWKNDGVV